MQNILNSYLILTKRQEWRGYLSTDFYYHYSNQNSTDTYKKHCYKFSWWKILLCICNWYILLFKNIWILAFVIQLIFSVLKLQFTTFVFQCSLQKADYGLNRTNSVKILKIRVARTMYERLETKRNWSWPVVYNKENVNLCKGKKKRAEHFAAVHVCWIRCKWSHYIGKIDATSSTSVTQLGNWWNYEGLTLVNTV